jgi:acetyltransferase-like isoleucine patch superfamily enzyme
VIALISRKAVVESGSRGDNLTVMDFAVIRENVAIGDNVIIHPHVVIEPGVKIGNNVVIYPGAYIGKEPGGPSLARKPGVSRSITIGDNCHIGPNSVIYYEVLIGKDTLVGDGASIREKCRTGHSCIIGRYATLNYAVSIGSGTRIMDFVVITGNSVIGDNVFIAHSVVTANDNKLGRSGYDEKNIRGPVIKDGASIGIGALILPAVVIGRNAVVAAGAVVTRDVPQNTFVMGMPARVVRKIK